MNKFLPATLSKGIPLMSLFEQEISSTKDGFFLRILFTEIFVRINIHTVLS